MINGLGIIPFPSIGAWCMFQFCSTIYERVALTVTANMQFADWVQIFQNERLSAALLDRLSDRAKILGFLGDSHRLRKPLKQKGRKEPAIC